MKILDPDAASGSKMSFKRKNQNLSQVPGDESLELMSLDSVERRDIGRDSDHSLIITFTRGNIKRYTPKGNKIYNAKSILPTQE